MLLAMSDDIRVVLIKLADRLHNMRTLGAMSPQRQEKIASETAYLYAPLAHRFGLFNIKMELEDLAFKYRFPAEYADIEAKVNNSEAERSAYIDLFKEPIVKKMQEQHIDFKISGRVKSLYSIWNKMQKKHVPFEEIYDIFALRIVFQPVESSSEKSQCFNIYSIITDIYQPNDERLRDWIKNPKVNGYEALHVTVMGPHGHWVELQIRTQRMDDIDERGYASHWRYKDNEDNITDIFKQDTEIDKLLHDIHDTLTSKEVNTTEFLDQLKLNLFSSEITAFTPKGKMISLPKNATVLDFAYAIHSKIGSRAIGAKVNYKLVPLSEPLHNGDQVEILTADNQKPKPEWLHFAITTYALNHIKNLLKKEDKEHLQKGKQIIENAVRAAGWFPNAMLYKRLSNAYGVHNKEELFSNVGAGLLSVDEVEKVVKKHLGRSKFLRYWELQLAPLVRKKTNYNIANTASSEQREDDENGNDNVFLLQENSNKLSYQIATCCKPIPGDDVIGFHTGEHSVLVHKKLCPNAIREAAQHGNDIVNVKWTEHKQVVFLAAIQIVSIDRPKLLIDVISVISVHFKGNIKNLTSRDHDGMIYTDIQFFVHDSLELHRIMKALAKIDGTKSVSRIDIEDEI
ncbi:GTP pyrophosphokinase [Bacteroidia bacterium]|nr:GTP pyrophosphokinase [Bacteroidia bacterium]